MNWSGLDWLYALVGVATCVFAFGVVGLMWRSDK